MKIGEMKERRDALRIRAHEIDARLSEMKRMWVCDGVATTLQERTSLEAEKAQLMLELRKLDLRIHAERKAESAIKRASFMFALVEMLQERGMSELVREAERISHDRMIGISMGGDKNICNEQNL